MGGIRGLKRKKKEEQDNNNEEVAPLLTSIPDQTHFSDWWHNFSKRFTGSLSESNDSANFELIFKISRRTFGYICFLVKDVLMARSSTFTDLSGQPLCLEDQVAVALLRLSSGTSLSIVGDSLQLNKSTVSKITWKFTEAMEQRGMHHLQWPSTETDMAVVKSKFETIRGLPNCCGAIDTTHIKMNLSVGDKSNVVWYDKEKNHSMILQAIVDSDMRFLDIVCGWPGSVSDSIVFESSNFFKLCNEGKRLNGKTLKLSERAKLKEYIVGDIGFPLLPWLLTPYQGRNISEYKVSFNRRHIATQMVAQKALSKLKETWKIIDGVVWRPDKDRLPRIIFVCCLLHNITIDLDDEVQKEIPVTSNHDFEYRQQICDTVDKAAATMRNKLSLFLSGRLST